MAGCSWRRRLAAGLVAALISLPALALAHEGEESSSVPAPPQAVEAAHHPEGAAEAADAPHQESVEVRVLSGDRLVTVASGQMTREHLLLPLRQVAEALGATVHWEEKTRTVLITQAGLGLPAQEPGVVADARVTVNGQPTAVPLVIVEGRSQVPLTFFTAWDDAMIWREGVGTLYIQPAGRGRGQQLAPAEKGYAVMGPGDAVTVLDLRRDQTLDVIPESRLPAAAFSHGLAVTPDGTKLYVASMSSSRLSVYDTVRTSVNEVEVGFAVHHLDADPAGRYIYATELQGTRLAILDATADRLLTTAEAGKGVYYVTASPDGRSVYVTNRGEDSVAILRTADWARVGTVAVGQGPSHMAVDPASGRLLVTNGASNDVTVIDPSSGKVVATVPVGLEPHGIAVSNGKAFVANVRSGDVDIISLQTLEIVRTVQVGQNPGHVHTSPSGRVYVQVEGERRLKVLDPGSGEIVRTLDLISDGHQIAAPSGMAP